MINRELIRLKVLQLVYSYYQNEGKTLDTAVKELEFSLQKAYDLYLYLLSTLIEVKHFGERRDAARKSREQRTGSSSKSKAPEALIAHNQFLRQLAENKAMVEFLENVKKPWDGEDALVKNLYTKFIESDVFLLYTRKEDFSYEADREIVRKLYKTYICHNDDIDSLIEDQSLYWNDDKDVIDTFVLKTIKRFHADSTPDQPLLPMYATEDDHEFALTLFRTTLERGPELRDLIKANTKNWEFSRLTFMDVVIMQIALAEILTFDSIPLNVTFNEYLDIAKLYSTSRSSSYINGMLDGIMKRLHESGRTDKQRMPSVKKKKPAFTAMPVDESLLYPDEEAPTEENATEAAE